MKSVESQLNNYKKIDDNRRNFLKKITTLNDNIVQNDRLGKFK